MLPTTLLIEIIAFFWAVYYLKNEKEWYRYFVPFMLLIILFEATGFLMAVFQMHNHWVYNIEMVAEIIFIPWAFHQLFKERNIHSPWMISTGFIMMVVAVVLETTLRDKKHPYNEYSYLVLSSVAVFYACVFFYYLIKSPEPVNYLGSAPTWIVAGLFIFYFCGSVAVVFFKELMMINITKGIPLRLIIFTILNAILYGCWIYAFRCRRLQTI